MSNKLDRYEFIWKAIQKHGYKYDYRKVDYKNNRTKVCIVCSEHGEFWQIPDNHLQGHKCSKCNGGTISNIDEFIEKARIVHGDKYDYSKVEYVNNKTKVCIICSKHGEFWQRPDNHLQGKGCLKCLKKSSQLEMKIEKILLHNNINYKKEYSFSFLKNKKGKQKLDFYLPDYNIAIECQGIQHFKPTDFSGKGEEWATKMFEENKIRDVRKFELCNEHNIKIIYINYFDTNEEIFLKLNNITKK